MKNIEYHVNPATGDRVFKGTEEDLREKIESLDFLINDEPIRHFATGAIVDSLNKTVFGADGEAIACLCAPRTGFGDWRLVVRHDGLPSESEEN